jgi:hypothetical protein
MISGFAGSGLGKKNGNFIPEAWWSLTSFRACMFELRLDE